MMTRQEKREKCELFIRSDSFTIDTWMAIHHFLINSDTFLDIINIKLNLINDLDREVTLNKIPEKLLRIKQLIILDIISRLVVLVEVTLILIDSLSTGNYRSIPEKMTYYSLESILHSVQKIKNNEYNWRKVLGLPKPSKLSLSKNEREYLRRNYEHDYAWIRNVATNLSEFYDMYRIAYGKSKHGLIIQTGLTYSTPSNSPMLDNSILICYDRRERERMPKNCIESISSGEHHSFFNAVGVLSFNQHLFTHIKSFVDELRYVIQYVCNNHLTYAKNCGEGYLPYVIHDNKLVIMLSRIPEEPEKDRLFRQIIADKVSPLINTADVELTTNFTTARQEIFDSISGRPVTNLWYK